MGRQEKKIREGAAALLADGEEILAACIVAPRGHTRSAVAPAGDVVGGVVVGEMGAKEQRGARSAAEQAGVRLASPMGLALTPGRLVILGISTPVGLGIGGKVREVLSEVPIAEVDSIDVKQIALRKNITLTVRGVAIELEANAAADTKGLTEGLARAKA